VLPIINNPVFRLNYSTIEYPKFELSLDNCLQRRENITKISLDKIKEGIELLPLYHPEVDDSMPSSTQRSKKDYHPEVMDSGTFKAN